MKPLVVTAVFALALSLGRAEGPANAADCHKLGMALRQGGDESHLREAASWLEKAAALAPNNADYVYDYGDACFAIADQERSFLFATRGRDAMKRAIGLDSGQLDARESLMEFYARAPWPLGSSARALEQAGEIGRRDRVRGLKADLKLSRIFEKGGDRRDARDACKAAIKLDPTNRAAAATLARLESHTP